MEFLLWREKMKRGLSLFLLIILLGIWAFAFVQKSQEPLHFYNVDTERKIKGTIQEIIMQPRYRDRSPFLVVVLEEKKTQQKFMVEISPVRFFTYDFHKGEEIEVLGSIYSNDEGSQNIIARQILYRGEVLILRDRNGFPAWRGGGMKAGQKRKGKRF